MPLTGKKHRIRLFWFVIAFVFVSTLANWAWVIQRDNELRKFDKLVAQVAFNDCRNAALTRDAFQESRIRTIAIYTAVLNVTDDPLFRESLRNAIAALQHPLPQFRCLDLSGNVKKLEVDSKPAPTTTP